MLCQILHLRIALFSFVFCYQLATRFVCGWLVLRLLYVFHVCLFVALCVPAHDVCYVTYIPYEFTLVNMTAALNTGVATMSSLV